MKKYLLVYEPNTSSCHIVRPIRDLFYDVIDVCSSDVINEIDHNLYHRIIFCYRKELHMWRKLKNNPLYNDKYIFLSKNNTAFPFKTASLGWTEYVEGCHKYYIPLASLLFWNKKIPDNVQPVVGFYINKQIYDQYEKQELRNIKKYWSDYNTTYELGVDFTNKLDFFNAITDFYYYVPKELDTMPCVLLEAMIAGIRVHTIGHRPHGGSHDLMTAYYGDNIKLSVYVKIWQKMIDSEFEYEFDKQKYRTFNEWIEGEIL